MMKTTLLCCPVLLIIVSLVISSSADLPTLYSCVDWDCEDWISKGKTLLTYVGKTDKHLSFKKNVDIYIISKPVDKSLPDWIGKVGSKVGLVPKDYVREDKMNKSPKFKLDLHDIPGFAHKEEAEQNDMVQEDDEAEDEGGDEEEIEIADVGDNIIIDDDIPAADTTTTTASTAEEGNASSSPPSTETVQTEKLQMETDSPTTAGISESESSPFSPFSLPSESGLNAQLTDEIVTKLEISSDAASDMINLQPSTDTILQGTTTQEYLAETPKTVEQKPTDDVTPRIPETVVHNILASIQSTNTVLVQEASSQIEGLSASRVEVSSVSDEETQTQFSLQVEEKTPESVESTPSEEKPLQTEDVPVPSKPESINVPSPPQTEDLPSEREVVSETLPETEADASSSQPEKSSTDPEGEGADLSPQPDDPATITDSVSPSPPDHDDNSPTSEENSPSGSVEDSTTVAPTEDLIASDQKDEESTETVVEDSTPSPVENSTPASVEEDSVQEHQTPTPEEDSGYPKVAALVDESNTVPVKIPASSDTTDPAVEDEVESTSASVEESTTPSSEDLSPSPESEEAEITTTAPIVEDLPSPISDEEPPSQTEKQDSPEIEDVVPHEDKDLSVVDDSTPSHTAPDDADVVSESLPPSDDTQSSQSIENVFSPPIVPLHQPSMESLEQKQEETAPEVASSFVEEGESNSEAPSVTESTPVIQDPPEATTEKVQQFQEDHHSHNHDDHHHHHHHHHGHRHHFKEFNDSESSSIILVIKHLSSTLLSFLPEPLQDTILDVDDALVFTGIIALTLVSICVPYFLIEGYMSVRPLKKKVNELNKSLWKVSAAYETQQEEFEIFKQKAIAHDEFKRRADQSENDVLILKKLETKHREQITALKTQLKSQMKEAVDIRALIEKTLDDKKVVVEECERYKAAYENAKEALVTSKEELGRFQNQAKSSALLLNTSGRNVEVLTAKITMLEHQTEEIKSQLATEVDKRQAVELEKREVEHSKSAVEKELSEFKNICHQYEGTVSGLNDEISKLESELTTIKETLGDDSPLLEIAEVQAKAAFLEKESNSLRTRLECLTADNENLSVKLKETASTLDDARAEREQTNNRLQVLEKYFKEREEEYIKQIEQLQLKESVRDKGKEELIRIIEERENVCKDLNERLEALKEEFEETKQQHRNEIRGLEAKGHENWLSLCQAERKAQDARKEAKLLRQRLTALSKEKDDEDVDGLNGEVPMFPVLPDELVPLPILDDPPSYFGLGDFVPPPPLPEGGEREPHRPPPLGGLGGRLSPSFSDLDDNILSPIGVGRREDDCTDGSSGSGSPRRSPPLRSSWVNDREGQGRESMRRLSRATSSPIQPGANL